MNKVDVTEFSLALMSPLKEVGALRTSTYQLKENDLMLNRHQVLHGIVSNYDSELNSLKCLGLLDYFYFIGEQILSSNKLRDGQESSSLSQTNVDT